MYAACSGMRETPGNGYRQYVGYQEDSWPLEISICRTLIEPLDSLYAWVVLPNLATHFDGERLSGLLRYCMDESPP